MDKKQIRKEIAVLINSIKEHSDNIGEKEHISQLELELILSKIEKLYKKSIVFNFLNSEKDNSKTTREIAKDETPVPPAKTEIKQEPVKGVDLFGSEVVPQEKVKSEKKPEKKEVAKEEKAAPVIVHKPSVSDIRGAIGINDKFRFANELFNGNIQEYEIAISQLNSAETLASAMEYFMNIQQLYNWDNENECVKSLYEIVERRYS
jgi:hypothetical protein